MVELDAPCLVSRADRRINQVRYASLKGIMAAKKKPLDTKSARRSGGCRDRLGAETPPSSPSRNIYIPPPKGDKAPRSSKARPIEVVEGLVGKIKELGLL